MKIKNTKFINEYTMDELVVAVEKGLEPRFVSLETSLKAHIENTVTKASFEDLVIMIGKGFNETTEKFRELNQKIDSLAWNKELFA